VKAASLTCLLLAGCGSTPAGDGGMTAEDLAASDQSIGAEDLARQDRTRADLLGECPPTSHDDFDCNYGGPTPHCVYPDAKCYCQGLANSWVCMPLACPELHPWAGDACADPGVWCNYGFEDGCGCIGPENLWICCYGQEACDARVKEGGLCCGFSQGFECMVGDCVKGDYRWCNCQSNHWKCVPVQCGGDMSLLDGGG
jgi:hypothetical protein